MSNSYNEENKKILCDYSDKCGCCAYAGMKYDNELNIKQKHIEELFTDLCRPEYIIGMYRPVYYRNKVHAVLGKNRNGEIISGTYQEGTHNIVNIKECLIEDKQCDKIIQSVKKLMKSFKYEPFDEDSHKGFIRHILVRKGFSTKEIMLVLITSEINFPSKNNFLKALLELHPEITTVVQNVNAMNTSMVLGNRNKTLFGKGYIEDVLCGIRFRIGPSSFYQINPQQTEKLYKAAIKMAALNKSDVLVDAYCGIGTIGLACAAHVKNVIGVELNQDAVKDAEVNAKLNNINNIRFVNADAGDFLIEYSKNKKADVVIMDPPRSGSTEEFLTSLIDIRPGRIVYISCNPDTQRRDIELLIKAGYKLKECRPFDMFPHTDDIENICLLTL